MLCEHFDGRALGQISALAVERFKRERAGTKTKFGGTRSPHTVNSELTTLSGILALAARHRFIRENPCGKVKHMRAFSRDGARDAGRSYHNRSRAAQGSRLRLAVSST